MEFPPSNTISRKKRSRNSITEAMAGTAFIVLFTTKMLNERIANVVRRRKELEPDDNTIVFTEVMPLLLYISSISIVN